MNLNEIKAGLLSRFTVFPTTHDVTRWLSANDIQWITMFNKSDVEQKLKKYCQTQLEERLNELNDDIKIALCSSLNFEINYEAEFGNDHSAWGSIIGGGTAMLVTLIEGIAFFPLALISIGIGFFVGKEKNKRDFIEEAYRSSLENAQKLAEEATKFIDEVTKNMASRPQLAPRRPSPQRTAPKEISLSPAQIKIKEFLEKRGIRCLVHFTDTKNVASIRRYGILSVEQLRKQGIHFVSNDDLRLDNALDYISLSVTYPNRHVMNAFKRNGSLTGVSVIYIDAKILYEEIQTHRFYCDRNAAASSCEKGSALCDFEKMFVPQLQYTTSLGARSCNRDHKKENQPTDEQAEILFRGRIDPKYIVEIRKW